MTTISPNGRLEVARARLSLLQMELNEREREGDDDGARDAGIRLAEASSKLRELQQA